MPSPTSSDAETGLGPCISVEDVSKCYHVYARPQERLWQALLRGRRRFFREFWALEGVSFEVQPGEAVGIVGRNGAGKSTLLQIIAGTLAPTQGHVRVRGRVAALLQIGAGFHPEYTGRENVYLAGSILGLSHANIDERFDQIAGFADIGFHLDQPVKTYSTGMYARLGFAVAVSTEPDLLIVDEVLAVGDMLFQQKCITRIKQMQERGLSLLFVSHSAARVNGLCQRGLLLQEGRQRYFGPVEECTNRYLADLRDRTNEEHGAGEARAPSKRVERQTRGVLRYGTQGIRIADVRVLDERGDPAAEFRYGDSIGIEVTWHCDVATEDLNVSYLVRDDAGVDLTGTMSWDEGVRLPAAEPGDEGRVLFRFANRLARGRYGISVALTRWNRETPTKPLLFDQIDGVAAFSVEPDPERPVYYKFDSQVEVKVS